MNKQKRIRPTRNGDNIAQKEAHLDLTAHETPAPVKSRPSRREALETRIKTQLARTGLLPSDLCALNLDDASPSSMEDIASEMLILAVDGEIAIRNTAGSTWSEKRIARTCLATALLAALGLVQKTCERTE